MDIDHKINLNTIHHNVKNIVLRISFLWQSNKKIILMKCSIAFEGASAFERLLLFRNAICFVSIKFHIIHLNFSVIFILLDIILVDGIFNVTRHIPT